MDPSEAIPPEPPNVAAQDRLDFYSWFNKDIKEQERILGDLVTTTTRMFLVGRTGLGKTLLGMSMAYHAACGKPFMHWACDRPCRVLYIDGEMPSELIKARVVKMLQHNPPPPPRNLMIYAKDEMEEFAKDFPDIGEIAALNNIDGQEFLKRLITALGKIDLIVFDNVMSLLIGDQKEGQPWNETLDLITWLTTNKIGQIWLDHTGHNSDRQYGSATKAWRMDAVGLMAPVEGGFKDELAFTLSFDHPGKARRRTPENYKDFATMLIKHTGGEWISETTEAKSLSKLRPRARSAYDILVPTLNGSGRGTVLGWQNRCVERGFIERADANETPHARRIRLTDFTKAKSELLQAEWIAIEGDFVVDLKGKW